MCENCLRAGIHQHQQTFGLTTTLEPVSRMAWAELAREGSRENSRVSD
jgi:hypothetical protein